MAPARSSTRRAVHTPSASHNEAGNELQNEGQSGNTQIFLDPGFGTPLAIFVEKEVEDRDNICQLIQKHGGTVSQGYSRVQYILVDPHKISGQNLYRQYADKKEKVVLNAQWVHECIKANAVQTYQNNWGGCKVTGTESIYPPRQPNDAESSNRSMPPIHPPTIPSTIPPVDQMQPFPFPIYSHPIHVPQPPPRHLPGPPGAWHIIGTPHPIQPAPSTSQQHLIRPPPPPPPPPPGQPPSPEHAYREGPWEGYHAPGDISGPQGSYEYRYREDQSGWVPSDTYYNPAYEHGYGQPHYLDDQPDHSSASNSVTGQPQLAEAGPSTQAAPSEPERPRGRKRTRNLPPPAVPASSLVVNRNPPARSPTPPTRVIKSTYGGNLFTADDVLYLKKYIDYCQDQCMVLSLREICERIAVKAPHHTFYSWRRYCNKHQIKLGGYTMNHDRNESPTGDDQMSMDVDGSSAPSRATISSMPLRLDMAAAKASAETVQERSRSPTPPRSLFRSTTGKGVAFTQEDVNFLMKFMAYRKSQGPWDVVAFWRDVASKAPHHSRASWMKFWRRHKHELDWEDGDEPLPPPPDKKLRYSKGDDILLAKYFYNKPDGTSDKIFQAFGRLHPHHPWKGWQEHHRIHRAKIEQLMERLANGETLDDSNVEET